MFYNNTSEINAIRPKKKKNAVGLGLWGDYAIQEIQWGDYAVQESNQMTQIM